MHERGTMDTRNIVIVALIAAVAVLGYLYWDSQRTGVEINVPGVHIKAK
jgi:hypothetical protein